MQVGVLSLFTPLAKWTRFLLWITRAIFESRLRFCVSTIPVLFSLGTTSNDVILASVSIEPLTRSCLVLIRMLHTDSMEVSS